MSSTMKKRKDNVDEGSNLLDSLVPDNNVKPSKSAWFENLIQNAKCKMCVASEAIKQRSMEIANWILNTRIVKSHLPVNVKNLIGIVMGTKYCVKPIIHKYSEGKLNAKRITALKYNAIIHKMEILDKVDPLNQMMLLNECKTFLLNEKLILFKGIECIETLDMKFEKLGDEGEMYEKSFSSRYQVIIYKYGIDFAL